MPLRLNHRRHVPRLLLLVFIFPENRRDTKSFFLLDQASQVVRPFPALLSRVNNSNTPAWLVPPACRPRRASPPTRHRRCRACRPRPSLRQRLDRELKAACCRPQSLGPGSGSPEPLRGLAGGPSPRADSASAGAKGPVLWQAEGVWGAAPRSLGTLCGSLDLDQAPSRAPSLCQRVPKCAFRLA